MDDVGASTKHFEVYSKVYLGNFLFLKYLKGFRAWGVYDEISPGGWNHIFNLISKYDAKITIGITATWVEKNNDLIPFYDKYPKQAKILKDASKDNLIEIANHGLTHCVVGKHLPRLFSSNRTYHREFWDWIPRDIHFQHLERSQKIFSDWLGFKPSTLIPPGNVYSSDTLDAAEQNGIKIINSYLKLKKKSKIKVINDSQIDAFHDREIVLEGIEYLKDKLDFYKNSYNFSFIKSYN